MKRGRHRHLFNKAIKLSLTFFYSSDFVIDGEYRDMAALPRGVALTRGTVSTDYGRLSEIIDQLQTLLHTEDTED